MDINKRLDEIEDVLTELQVFLNGEGILPGVHYFGDNDVVKREPEIKACPNPTCEQTKYLEIIEVPSMYSHPNKAFIVECKNCGYRGGRGSSKEQAVKLHNLICEKTAVTNVVNINDCQERNCNGQDN